MRGGCLVVGQIPQTQVTNRQMLVSPVVATSGAHTIAFTRTDPNDKTTFIDGVTVQ